VSTTNNPNPNKPLDPSTLPPKLRAVYKAARRLARIRTQKILWANTLKALTPIGRPG
jgi:hypothetical protein